MRSPSSSMTSIIVPPWERPAAEPRRRGQEEGPARRAPGRPLRGAAASRGPAALAAELHHVLGGRALLALHDVELHPLALGQRLEAAALDGGVVDEAILLAAFRRDEAEPLGIVEPLDG